MPTLQFSKNIKRRGEEFENSASELVRQTAKRSLRSVVFNTKADTGKARSNWQVGIGSPPSGVRQAYVPYKKGSKANGQGAGETANAAATIAAGNARINSVRGISGRGLATGVYISNRVPYIRKALLAGGVEVAVAEARAVLRGFRFFRGRGRFFG